MLTTSDGHKPLQVSDVYGGIRTKKIVPTAPGKSILAKRWARAAMATAANSRWRLRSMVSVTPQSRARFGLSRILRSSLIIWLNGIPYERIRGWGFEPVAVWLKVGGGRRQE